MNTQAKITVRRATDRGTTDLGWLQSRHSFAFGQYQDPANTHYRVLRVINDDRVMPDAGFGEHSHDNMEIMTWVISGALKHGDSLGNMQTLRPGELQVMTAGTGIRHSEFNASDDEPVHFLQIWIFPKDRDAKPQYIQQTFDAEDRLNQWDTFASGMGDSGAVTINQDAAMRIADLQPSREIIVSLAEKRFGYLHIATGRVRMNDLTLEAGDAITFANKTDLQIHAEEMSQLLLFDLP